MERRQAVKTIGLTIGMFFGLRPINISGTNKDLIEEQLKFFREELTNSQYIEFIVLVRDLIHEELHDLPDPEDKDGASKVLFEIVKEKVFNQEISLDICELLKDGLKSFEKAMDDFDEKQPKLPYKDKLAQIETSGVDGQFSEAKKLISYLRNDLVKDICTEARKEFS